MNLLDLKREFYAVIGDRVENPRLCQPVEMMGWMNDGTALARGLCGDIWGRAVVQAQAGVGRYTLPADAHRALRIAYGWRTLYEMSHAELNAHDVGWEERSGLPEVFTQDGEAHNAFTVYRKPTATSAALLDMVIDSHGSVAAADYGIVGRIVRSGVDVDFNADFGEVGRASWITVAPDFGVVGQVSQVPDDAFVVWFVRKAEPMLDDAAPVPIRRPFSRLPLWYALSRYYGSESERRNSILGALYRDWFYGDLSKLRTMCAHPLPRQEHIRGGGPAGRVYRGRHPYADTMTPPGGGGPIHLIW